MSARVRKRLGIGIAVLVLLGLAGGVGVPYVYIHFIKDDPPPPLSFEARDKALAGDTGAGSTAPAPTTAPAAATTELSGTWKVVQPSEAGYRVKEILLGQDTEGVGRTDAVDGTVTIEGTTVRTAELGVDLSSVTSDDSRRDGQFRNRIMNTADFPVALFVLGTPIELGSLPAPGTAVSVKAAGTLTLRGVDKEVVIELSARRTEAGTIEAQGSYDVQFADFAIPDPSNLTAATQDHGLLEFLVTLARAE